MGDLNGTQLYGIRRLLATLRMGMHRGVRGLSIRKKLALNYVFKESKLTRMGHKIYSNTFTPYFPSAAYDRFLKGITAVASGNPTPVIANFAVTPQCPCRCWHCSFADRSIKDVLSLGEITNAIADVQNMGASVIGLTGGEPLLRNDLDEIIASIDERSMPLLFTTGYGLTSERVRRLRKAGLEIPVVSLDHYSSERHDQGRRKPGMFDHALNAIRLFKEEGFYVAVSFVPDRNLVDNRDELFKTIDFFRDLGINDMRLTSPILSGRLVYQPEALLSRENVQTIHEIQKKCTQTPGYPGVFAYDYFESQKYYGCGAGYNYMFVDSQGNVSPCDFTMLSFGNIREMPITDIWEEMNQNFQTPGCVCYANKSSKCIAARNPDRWPLDTATTKAVVNECPPGDGRLPEFYSRWGRDPTLKKLPGRSKRKPATMPADD
jgi:MoaA/NifB/PqqE/SkfB family radical SAM enzyme